MKTRFNRLILVLALGSVLGCQKNFLEVKPNKALLVPTTLTDFQSLLDNLAVMNVVPGMQRIMTDELYTTAAGLQAYSTATERNGYTWARDLYQGAPSQDWGIPYQQVFYANIVLDGLVKLAPANGVDADRVQGSALFYRAVAFYHLAQLFTQPYRSTSAGQDPGIPLPLTANVNRRYGRGTLAQVYERILNDLEAAVPLLPLTPALKSRPSRPAALGFLARVSLTMGDYTRAQDYANRCLQLKSALLDYNSLSLATLRFPPDLPNGNDEVLFHSIPLLYSFNYSAVTGLDTTVSRTFGANDLRKNFLLYALPGGYTTFNDTYAGDAGLFAGLATDELYLIRAECLARGGHIAEAMSDLNTLLVTRYKKGTYVPLTAATKAEAITTVLRERRKELLTNQGILRWVDLRRLNLEPDYAVTVKRVLNGQVYTLPPNDPRYVFPIPDNELNSGGIAQNPR